MRTAAVPLVVLLSSFLAAGCASRRVEPAAFPGGPTGLGFLAAGATTRQDVVLRLGEPSGRFERDRLLTYRLDADWQVVRVLRAETGANADWSTARYSMLLVFDDSGVLVEKRMLRVR